MCLTFGFRPGFANNGLATQVPVIIGITTIIYSLFTRYELGVFKVIPFNIHMVIDYTAGIFLAVSPWLLAYSDYIYLPHLIVGIVEIVITVMTENRGEVGVAQPHA